MARSPCRDCGGDKGDAPPGAWRCNPCRDSKKPMFLQTTENSEARPGYKQCSTCKNYRPAGNFKGNKCKPCISLASFEKNINKKYNLTVEEYNSLLEMQDGKCAICQTKPRAKRLAVDHNHKTGRVRGLLCGQCNHKLLGGARDSLDILRRAVYYMESPPYDRMEK